MQSMIKKVFGTRNERLLNNLRKIVKQTNQLETTIESLTDSELAAKTPEFRKRLVEGERLENLIPEAFAVVREAAKRTLNMRHFDVQLIGGLVLNSGKVAEMRTGEGKTLAATLPAYLNALSSKGVHIVTVNDYLAERDANWMRPVYESLGLTVGINLSGMEHDQKQQAYAADITFGTNNEFGFDYLRDNMVFSIDQRVQRPLHYAIIDEVDSILIDEARTPLIISGQAEESSDLYQKIIKIIPQLKKQQEEEGAGDYSVDEKNRQVFLTDEGHKSIEALLNQADILKEDDSLYSINNISMMHYVMACLRAHTLFQRDVDYLVKDGQIMIIDEHTGRLMEGRRWSEGLHQAMEAKEGVKIQLENQTLATITFQNYFRIYEKLSGMTGTADTEAFELQSIYGLEVAVIPTNKPMVRKDHADQIYLTSKEKYDAIITRIKEVHETKQPILVGTASVENSEFLSDLLKKQGVKHQVLNAKQHEREASVIVEAGRPGSVTIATNMAGRGTDIVLGGNLEAELSQIDENDTIQHEAIKKDWQQRHDQVLEAGGLFVLGTERHESRRIDNQLRGRSGRQGDAGSSLFYLSLEDNLLRIFAAERLSGMMRKLGLKEGEAIEHSWINKTIENAQRRVEGLNFDIRKNLLEYDDVANDQRKVIYQQRYDIMSSEKVSQYLSKIRHDAIEELVHTYMPENSMEEEWDIAALEKSLAQDFLYETKLQNMLDQDGNITDEDIIEKTISQLEQDYEKKMLDVPDESRADIERSILLQLLDTSWKDHLANMDHLRQGIHLRGYAQKNPTQEYKRESFNLFTEMISQLKYDVISTLSKIDIVPEQQAPKELQQPTMHFQHDESQLFDNQQDQAEQGTQDATEKIQPFTREQPKVGRNNPCPCGSGKKYKHCHGHIKVH